MNILIKNRLNSIELIPMGKLEIGSADEFEEEFKTKALESTSVNIGLNLKEINYIDSSGLGILIKATNLSKNKSKNLIVFNVSDKIKNVFKIARLEKFFNFISKEEYEKLYPLIED